MKIAITGSGNVGTHLAKALGGKADVSLVNPRTLAGMPHDCDLAIVAVKDDAVARVTDSLRGLAPVIAHTSGSVPMQPAGDGSRTGVIYPMQTFTKGVAMDYSNIPVFVEGCDSGTEELLTDVARMFSANVSHADSDGRKRLHLAAVFACNFTNCLAGISAEILSGSGIDFSVMLPLMDQAVAKLHTTSPGEAQTGPAARNDREVMHRQLAMLADKPQLAEIYRLLSDRIMASSIKSTGLDVVSRPAATAK